MKDVSKDFQDIKPSKIRSIVNKTHDLVGEGLSSIIDIVDELEENNYADRKTIKKIVDRYYYVIYKKGRGKKELEPFIEKMLESKKKEIDKYGDTFK
ncbi:MAG: hypothetical protein KDK90_13265 [Leptospiraceae bacterium]|nr:hypothetical protein [Leptospiraceae bacterium]